MNKKELLDSNHFCILPFMSSRVWHGFAVPCCINHETVFGLSVNTPIDEIYSADNPILTDFRKQLIQGPGLPDTCSRCKDSEKSNVKSYRQRSNERWAHVIDKLDFDGNGVMLENKFYFWDGVSYSNLCNLKCRMCPSFLSSSTRAEEVRHNLEIKSISTLHETAINQYLETNKMPTMAFESFNDVNEIYNFFNNHIDYIEEIKFEGGEPMMIEHHYKILEMLITRGKTDIILKYVTNGTQLKLKHYDVLDMWSKFKTVAIDVSLDSITDKNFYIRHPSNWDDIISNINNIKDKCPHVNIGINITMQLLNSFSAVDIHRWCLDNNLRYNFIFLKHPSYFSMQILPVEYKTRVQEHWNNYKKTISYTENIDGMLRMMWAEDHSDRLPEFFIRIKERDVIRNEDFLTTFPEFGDLK